MTCIYGRTLDFVRQHLVSIETQCSREVDDNREVLGGRRYAI